MTDENKVCRACGLLKEASSFGRDGVPRKDGRDRLRPRCRECELRSGGNRCCDCGIFIYPGKTRCKPCNGIHGAGPGHHRWKGGVTGAPGGYLKERCVDHPRSNAGYVLQHVLVLEEYLGRPILANEQVHHKNGIRTDNRVENLELWSTFHPSGQRITDLVSWAKELLWQYEPEALSFDVADAEQAGRLFNQFYSREPAHILHGAANMSPSAIVEMFKRHMDTPEVVEELLHASSFVAA